jgi:SpoU rRNA methylase family enzyme
MRPWNARKTKMNYDELLAGLATLRRMAPRDAEPALATCIERIQQLVQAAAARRPPPALSITTFNAGGIRKKKGGLDLYDVRRGVTNPSLADIARGPDGARETDGTSESDESDESDGAGESADATPWPFFQNPRLSGSEICKAGKPVRIVREGIEALAGAPVLVVQELRDAAVAEELAAAILRVTGVRFDVAAVQTMHDAALYTSVSAVFVRHSARTTVERFDAPLVELRRHAIDAIDDILGGLDALSRTDAQRLVNWVPNEAARAVFLTHVRPPGGREALLGVMHLRWHMNSKALKPIAALIEAALGETRADITAPEAVRQLTICCVARLARSMGLPLLLVGDTNDARGTLPPAASQLVAHRPAADTTATNVLDFAIADRVFRSVRAERVRDLHGELRAAMKDTMPLGTNTDTQIAALLSDHVPVRVTVGRWPPVAP